MESSNESGEHENREPDEPIGWFVLFGTGERAFVKLERGYTAALNMAARLHGTVLVAFERRRPPRSEVPHDVDSRIG